ncbi:IclR family transcriptional regulator [Peterkaempfera griseoplana]|uniref:IclR family transcriptional regulator n=1 Tax=Peterkaempfera griseoplana TaxID=66896 RepID=UPI0007C85AE7|nr:IclR family transcriptional regulator [Peterkaempfera griseoplana]
MPRSSSSAVDKALDLIEAVARSDRPIRLSELAEEVGLHRATAYRVLLDLVRRGWVLRAGDHYLPGTVALQLSHASATRSLAAVSRPVLETLSARTGMMVNLQVLESDRSRVIDAIRPARLEMISDLRDSTLPVHRFAGPLALVATLPPEARRPYLRQAEEAGRTSADDDRLAADIAQAERAGYALERGRNEKLVASVSRAVTTAKGAPICALTVVGPDTEFEEPLLTEVIAALHEATAELQRTLTVLSSDTAGPQPPAAEQRSDDPAGADPEAAHPLPPEGSR